MNFIFYYGDFGDGVKKKLHSHFQASAPKTAGTYCISATTVYWYNSGVIIKGNTCEFVSDVQISVYMLLVHTYWKMKMPLSKNEIFQTKQKSVTKKLVKF